MQTEILDDYIADREGHLLRTHKLERLENACFTAYAFSLIIFFFSNIYYNGIEALLNYNSYPTAYFIRIFIIVGAIWWWRNLSIQYDNDLAIKEFRLPILLHISRCIIGIYIFTSIFNFFQLFIVLLSLSLDFMTLISQLISTFITIITAYHLYYTYRLKQNHQTLLETHE